MSIISRFAVEWLSKAELRDAIVGLLPSKARPEEFKVKLGKWNFERTLNGKDVTVDLTCKHLE